MEDATSLHLRDSGFNGGDEAHYAPDLELEPVHRDIALTVDLDARRATGLVTTTVRSRRPDAASMALHAEDLTQVRVRDADGRPLEWSYDGRLIHLHWSEGLDEGEERRVEIHYDVVEPRSGLFFSSPTDAYPNAALYAATSHETERARHWLPCIDLPSVRTTLDFHLRAPEDLEILANGELLELEIHGDGTKTAHWHLSQRCPSYLTCFAIGDFIKVDDGEVDGTPIAYYASADHSQDQLLRSFGRTGSMLRWMIDKLDAPFPFPKYSQFALPGFGGAMENISLVSWNDLFVMDEALATEWTWLVDLINVHEMAHSYFGDLVVCRDFAHAWLKESWATYIEQCWLEDTQGEDEALYDYHRKAEAYLTEADEQYKRPLVTRVFRSSWQMYDRHLYPGGSCRLHTLRSELGDTVFWEGVREYVREYSHRVVETDDFRRVMERRSGRSLGRFFDQWFHTAAYPDLKVVFTFDAEQREGRFEIEQRQVDAAQHIPAFALRTEVGWFRDGVMHTKAVRVESAREVVLVPMDGAPDHVRFDPFSKVLHKLEFDPGDAMLRHQLVHAPDVVGRIIAARGLARSGKGTNIDALMDAYAAEPFWGVREQMAKSLANAHTDRGVAALAVLIDSEQHPTVLASAIGAAKVYRDPRIARAVERRLDDGLAHMASAAAYETLGCQRTEAFFERLRDASRVEGYGGWSQSGALRGLAASGHPEALGLLTSAVIPGATPSHARPAAAKALADWASRQPVEVRVSVADVLVDRLRDPDPAVQRAAALAMRTLQVRSSEVQDALEGYRATVSAQERVAVDGVLSDLRAGGDPKIAALEKQVDALQRAVRKLGVDLAEAQARSHNEPNQAID